MEIAEEDMDRIHAANHQIVGALRDNKISSPTAEFVLMRLFVLSACISGIDERSCHELMDDLFEAQGAPDATH